MPNTCVECGKSAQQTPASRIRRDKRGHAPPSWNAPKIKKIYGIREMGTAQFVYIGQTTARLTDRLYEHSRADNSISTLREWFTELESRGAKAEIVLLEELNYGCNQFTHERLWIQRLQETHKLLNRITYAVFDVKGKQETKRQWKADLFANAILYTGPMWLEGAGKYPNRRRKYLLANSKPDAEINL